MRKIIFAALLATSVSPAEAAIRYSLAGTHFNQPALLEFTLPTFVSSTTLLKGSLSACSFKNFGGFDIPCGYVNISSNNSHDYITVHNYQNYLPAFYGVAADSFATLGTHESGTSNGDHGWLTVSLVGAPVPEPATWMMMILGFGAIGFALRHRVDKVRIRQPEVNG